MRLDVSDAIMSGARSHQFCENKPYIDAFNTGRTLPLTTLAANTGSLHSLY